LKVPILVVRFPVDVTRQLMAGTATLIAVPTFTIYGGEAHRTGRGTTLCASRSLGSFGATPRRLAAMPRGPGTAPAFITRAGAAVPLRRAVFARAAWPLIAAFRVVRGGAPWQPHGARFATLPLGGLLRPWHAPVAAELRVDEPPQSERRRDVWLRRGPPQPDVPQPAPPLDAPPAAPRSASAAGSSGADGTRPLRRPLAHVPLPVPVAPAARGVDVTGQPAGALAGARLR
jgi:hypothetical protein